MSERKYKQFPSLYKRKSGFQPLNNLQKQGLDPIDKPEPRPITITEPLKELSAHSNAPSAYVGPLSNPVPVPKQPSNRYIISDLPSPKSKSQYRFYSSHTLKKIKESDQILTSFGTSITISSTDLTSDPMLSFHVDSIVFNDITFNDDKLFLNVSRNQKFLFFSREDMLINKLIVDRIKHLDTIKFGTDKKSLLIELKHYRGYIFATYTKDDAELIRFFDLQKQWSVKPKPRHSPDELLAIMKLNRLQNKEHVKLPANHIAPKIRPTRSNTSSGEAELLTTITNSDGSITMVEKEKDEPIPYEKPADFDPELKFSFRNKKEFIISYSDFKTLYNNDWINDSLIDFFILYEIERAIYELHTVKENEIHAFNSFFFTKLMSKSDTYDTVDYYANIKRWLNKLDLMSFPYVIMPICENLHWYGCLIKGLPDLLKPALPPQDPDYEENKPKVKSQSPDTGSPSKSPATGFSRKLSNVADIYIFDSLSQRHSNIGDPIKSFIVDYCYDKHGITVTKDRIRVHTAKVPKQKNFNDCGIHVIYNVRKLLSLPDECEKIWRSNSKHVARMFFGATERLGMRKELIDKLLELHKKQTESHEEFKRLNPESNTKVEHSDDEIEVIEYKPGKEETSSTTVEQLKQEEVSTPVKASVEEKVTPNGKETSTSTPTGSIQRLKQSLERGRELLQIPTSSTALRNKSLREMFANQLLSPSVINILNDIFPDKLRKFNAEQSSLIIDLKKALEANGDIDVRKKKIHHFLLVFRALGSTGATPSKERPMNESFKIDVKNDRDNSSDDLNRSVDNLHISNPPFKARNYTESKLSSKQYSPSENESMELDQSLIKAEGKDEKDSLQAVLQADLEAQIAAQSSLHNQAEVISSVLEVPDSQSSDKALETPETITINSHPKEIIDSVEVEDSQDEEIIPKPTSNEVPIVLPSQLQKADEPKPDQLEVVIVDEKRVKRKTTEKDKEETPNLTPHSNKHYDIKSSGEKPKTEHSKTKSTINKSVIDALMAQGTLLLSSKSASSTPLKQHSTPTPNGNSTRILRSTDSQKDDPDVQEIEFLDVDKDFPEEEAVDKSAKDDELKEIESPAFSEGFFSPSISQSPKFGDSFEFTNAASGDEDNLSPLARSLRRKRQEKLASDRHNRVMSIKKKLAEMAEPQILGKSQNSSIIGFPSLVEYGLQRISIPKYGESLKQEARKVSKDVSDKGLKSPPGKTVHVSRKSPELPAKENDILEVVSSDDDDTRRSRSVERVYKKGSPIVSANDITHLHTLISRSRSKRRRLNGTHQQ